MLLFILYIVLFPLFYFLPSLLYLCSWSWKCFVQSPPLFFVLFFYYIDRFSDSSGSRNGSCHSAVHSAHLRRTYRRDDGNHHKVSEWMCVHVWLSLLVSLRRHWKGDGWFMSMTTRWVNVHACINVWLSYFRCYWDDVDVMLFNSFLCVCSYVDVDPEVVGQPKGGKKGRKEIWIIVWIAWWLHFFLHFFFSIPGSFWS